MAAVDKSRPNAKSICLKRLKSEADAKNAQKTRRMDTLVSYAQAAALWRQENTCSFAFSKMTAFITFT